MNTGLMSSMNSSMEKGVNMTGDFDVDFATMMIEHHQGALDMSEMEIAQGKDEKNEVNGTKDNHRSKRRTVKTQRFCYRL
jgi:uncharacterized protein (DUF305 family)